MTTPTLTDPTLTPTPPKPGYKTVAFYASLVLTAFGALAASGSDVGGLGVIGFVFTSLSAAGYTAWRGFKKSENAKKPAWKTTEFWLSVSAALVAAVYASGLFAATSTVGKIVAAASALLASAGYAVKPKT